MENHAKSMNGLIQDQEQVFIHTDMLLKMSVFTKLELWLMFKAKLSKDNTEKIHRGPFVKSV